MTQGCGVWGLPYFRPSLELCQMKLLRQALSGEWCAHGIVLCCCVCVCWCLQVGAYGDRGVPMHACYVITMLLP
jgi:hypothetical protein